MNLKMIIIIICAAPYLSHVASTHLFMEEMQDLVDELMALRIKPHAMRAKRGFIDDLFSGLKNKVLAAYNTTQLLTGGAAALIKKALPKLDFLSSEQKAMTAVAVDKVNSAVQNLVGTFNESLREAREIAKASNKTDYEACFRHDSFNFIKIGLSLGGAVAGCGLKQAQTLASLGLELIKVGGSIATYPAVLGFDVITHPFAIGQVGSKIGNFYEEIKARVKQILNEAYHLVSDTPVSLISCSVKGLYHLREVLTRRSSTIALCVAKKTQDQLFDIAQLNATPEEKKLLMENASR